mmetsp:Transcript_7818/g.8947  ORF Transcript_7818/g.8947 Transcript_7818/m.8947 type:complete len:141 (+) Transcript_7818:44-466(+)
MLRLLHRSHNKLASSLAAFGVPCSLLSTGALAGLPPHLKALHNELNAGTAQLFDVREPDESAAGRLVQAKLVPLSELGSGQVPPHDKTMLTYLHCRSGKRVMSAAPILESQGFEHVVPLNEGFVQLAELGFESTTEPLQR